MNLQTAFGLGRGEVVSLTGAGGKTSLLLGIGQELSQAGWRVLATTTTRIAESQLRLIPGALRAERGARAISQALESDRFVFLYDEIRGEKVYGPPETTIGWLLDALDADILLIEADGARGLPLKAPYPHEPVIVPETTLVIVSALIHVLGQPLNEAHVYNPEAIIDQYGFYPGAPIKSPWLAQIIRDETLGMKGVPRGARALAFLNGVPASGYLRGRARMVARLALSHSRLHGVALGDVHYKTETLPVVHEIQRRVGAVVLAAGMSRRMGEPKVLLPWSGGKTILEHILQQLILTRAEPIIVVSGNRADAVRQIAEQMGVQWVHNPDYERTDMLTSLKHGLRAMPDSVSAALVVLGDQPRIQPRIIGQVLAAYAEGRGTIVAPSYQMRRGHPILIDRRFWQELLALPDDAAPRDVINVHADQVAYVVTEDDSVLRDVDTPEDYREERRRAGLG